MRTKRGFIASLGAATSLILAGTLALASVSTVIAFRGWPGVRMPPVLPNSTVLAVAESDKPAESSPDSITVAAAPLSPKRVAMTHRLSASGKQSDRTVVVSEADSSPASVPAPSSSASPVGTASKPAPSGSKPAPAADSRKTVLGKTVAKVGDGLGNTVQGTGKVLGGVVEPVSPTLSQVVTNATDAVGGLVKKATDLVGAILDSVLPQRQPQQPAPEQQPATQP